MAEVKKKDAGAGAGTSPFDKDHYKEVIYIVLPALFLLALLLERLFAYVDVLNYSLLTSYWDKFFYALKHFWTFWKPVAALLSLVAIGVCVYSQRRLRDIEDEEEKIYGHIPADTFLEEEKVKAKQGEKWEKVMAHVHSENPAEWRLAIIEADVILESLLTDLGYEGEGIGERLKAVDPTDMLTLDKAWEAHKVRNRIAHSGQDFELTERETKRVIKLFEEVFSEFGII